MEDLHSASLPELLALVEDLAKLWDRVQRLHLEPILAGRESG